MIQKLGYLSSMKKRGERSGDGRGDAQVSFQIVCLKVVFVTHVLTLTNADIPIVTLHLTFGKMKDYSNS